ncbi:unnamed protein product [Brassica oleracea]
MKTKFHCLLIRKKVLREFCIIYFLKKKMRVSLIFVGLLFVWRK